MRNLIFLIAILSLPHSLHSQNGATGGSVALDFYSSLRFERDYQSNLSHMALRPFWVWEGQGDSNLQARPLKSIPFKKGLFSKSHSYLRVAPRFRLNSFVSSAQSPGFDAFGGAALDGRLFNKIDFNLEGIAGLIQPMDYRANLIDSIGVMPGFGHRKKHGPNYQYHQLTYHLAYRPSDWSVISFGRGNTFIGEGYRSLFISDFSPNVDYLKLDIEVWKLRYQVMYSKMLQGRAYGSAVYPLQDKYATMHYLSINITKWWNVGAFETVVWEGEDGAVNRNFDINYLNPIIFYRPVEFGMGSSDNALLGFTSSISPLNGLRFYGSAMLDEFLFREVMAPFRALLDSTVQTGSFRNKQAYQLGIKYHNPFGLKNASAILEANIVRPYIYAHSSEYQSYTHLNQPLAHPLGANFLEWVFVSTWQPKNWNISLTAILHRKGYSNQPRPFGEDPMQPLPGFDDRQYGNFIGQGRREDVANVMLDVQYTLVDAWNLRIGGSIHNRYVRTKLASEHTLFFSLGVSTAFQNIERAY